MDNFTIKSTNLERYANKLANLERPTFRSLQNYVVRSSEAVAGQARSKAPVNNGPLRASITTQYNSTGPGYVESSIGTNLTYAPYMEYGTGLVHDHPSWGRKRHVVPYKALLGWARRKLGGGSDRQVTSFAIAVAKNIMKRGGLLPRRFLRGSLEAFEPRIKADAQLIVAAIKREAGLT